MRIFIILIFTLNFINKNNYIVDKQINEYNIALETNKNGTYMYLTTNHP